MSDNPLDVNQLLDHARAVGNENLYAVAIVDGVPIRFAIVGVSRNGDNELELALERRTT